jgi:HlyD family secretion protein
MRSTAVFTPIRQPRPGRRAAWPALLVVAAASTLAGCRAAAPTDRVRVSGHVEATEVQIAPEVGGRLIELAIDEGTRVKAGDPIARLDTRDTELAIARLRAERDQADAQLRLLKAGSRHEDVQQASAQAQATDAEIAAADADLAAAEADLGRYDALLKANAGSRKQRDDALARRDMAKSRLASTTERARASRETFARVKAGSRPQEIQAAAARLATVDAQIAQLQKQLDDARVTSPVSGVVTAKLVDRGELLAPRAGIAVVTDIDHAWADLFVDEPVVPRLRLGQAAVLFTDAGGEGVPGTVTYISPKAEFTPRNVQTAEERSRLVYRIKVTVDNSKGVLKQGMPVEAELKLQ